MFDWLEGLSAKLVFDIFGFQEKSAIGDALHFLYVILSRFLSF